MANVTLDAPILDLVTERSFPGQPVVVESSEFHKFSNKTLGYLAVHTLLLLKIKDVQEPLTFFVKTPTRECGAPEGYFETEAKFYAEVLSLFEREVKIPEPWCPRSFYADNEAIVLEDLRVQKFESRDNWTLDEYRSALRALARLHTSSIVLEKKLGSTIVRNFPEKMLIYAGKQKRWLDSGIEAAEAIAHDLGHESGLIRSAYQLALKKVLPTEDGVNVLCHEDLWSQNLMFRGKDECRLVDLQTASYTSFAIDFLQLLHENADLDFRRRYEEELVGVYFEEVQKILEMNEIRENPLGSLERTREIIESKRVCGLVTAVQVLPIALLNSDCADEYGKEENYEKYNYVSRVEFVRRCMREDESYKKRIVEVVTELIEYVTKTL